MFSSSNIYSALAKISSSMMLEQTPACFYCNNTFNISQSSLRYPGNNVVKILGVKIAGD